MSDNTEDSKLRTKYVISKDVLKALDVEQKLLDGSADLVLSGGSWKCKQKSKKRKCEWKTA